jgi:hypothetical protein
MTTMTWNDGRETRVDEGVSREDDGDDGEELVLQGGQEFRHDATEGTEDRRHRGRETCSEDEGQEFRHKLPESHGCRCVAECFNE